MVRTTLPIDLALVEEAMRLSGARTKTEAISHALGGFVRRRQRQLLREELAAYDLSLNLDELRHLRGAG